MTHDPVLSEARRNLASGMKPGEALRAAREADHVDDILELSKRVGKRVRISSARLVIEGVLVRVDVPRVKVWVREKSKTSGIMMMTSVRLSKSSNVSWEE